MFFFFLNVWRTRVVNPYVSLHAIFLVRACQVSLVVNLWRYRTIWSVTYTFGASLFVPEEAMQHGLLLKIQTLIGLVLQ